MYAFRIWSKLSPHQSIEDENGLVEISLPPDGKSISINASVKRTAGQGSNDLVVYGDGCSSEQEAFDYGRRIKNALMVCGAILHMGVDAGKDEPLPGEFKWTTDQGRETLPALLNEVHGLYVFPQAEKVLFTGFHVGIAVTRIKLSAFVEEFAKGFEANYAVSSKELLALELYNMSHFESSITARFLTLMSAVESLSERKRRNTQVIEHVEKLIATTTASGLDLPERDSLLNGLRNLEKESISKACRDLIAGTLGVAAAKLFVSLYGIRSSMLHTGEVPQGVDLEKELGILDRLVSALVIAVLNRKDLYQQKGEAVHLKSYDL